MKNKESFCREKKKEIERACKKKLQGKNKVESGGENLQGSPFPHLKRKTQRGRPKLKQGRQQEESPSFRKKKEHRRERGLCFRLKETGEEIEEDGVLPNKFRATNTSPR